MNPGQSPEPRDLRGQVAIVTGAGKGLGRAYAMHLAARGASVLVNNRRHAGQSDAQTSAHDTVASIEAEGGQAAANWCDVSDPDSGRQLVDQALSRFGRLDIVIGNAAVDTACSFRKQSLADFKAIFDVSFFGNLYLVHAAWPHLIHQGYGRVVLTTSSAGLHGNHGQSAYSAAKSAVIGLMRSLAIEGGRSGVRVNAIAPYGHTQMTAPHMGERMAAALAPERVSPLVGWLCSPDCDVTGTVLVCGGGGLRQARSVETPATRLDERNPGGSVRALANQPAQGHATASDSYRSFLAELDIQEVSDP
ncbi:MAG: SDR family NAD(P)-dependent oxidoreductase [Rhodoferax sp.]|nr:SDR family NAD(P)-dependent oxidoreductase [Rhodoferax sp.]